MKTVIIKTLGCKVNQCESEAIGDALQADGQAVVGATTGGADVVVVNTCTVTAKAAMQSRQAVRQAIRANPGARIVVTGCYAQTAPDELAAIAGVDLIVGNGDKHRIPQRIRTDGPGKGVKVRPDDQPGAAEARFDAPPGIARGRRTRPFLKVQDGCDAFCTYCIVPYARGRSRSMPVAQVLHQVDILGRLGYREVVLTGIHIGRYGLDLTPATGLYDLLCRIRDSGAVDRIRLSSIEPNELTHEIVALAAADGSPGRLCPHFHIPLQSGDDDVLRRMRRPYRGEDVAQLVHGIVERLPEAAIGVDTLLGFPGETDAAAAKTVALIEALPVAYLHVFPFSPRRGTPAFSFAEQVPAGVIKTRCARMRRLGGQKRRTFYQRHVGRTIEILVETTRDRSTGWLRGLTDNYVPVRVDGPDGLCNTLHPVEVVRVASDGVPEGRLAGRGGIGQRPTTARPNPQTDFSLTPKPR